MGTRWVFLCFDFITADIAVVSFLKVQKLPVLLKTESLERRLYPCIVLLIIYTNLGVQRFPQDVHWEDPILYISADDRISQASPPETTIVEDPVAALKLYFYF